MKWVITGYYGCNELRLGKLLELGYENVFIDEVTLMEDFIDSAALIEDMNHRS